MRILMYTFFIAALLACRQDMPKEEHDTGAKSIDWAYADSLKKAIGRTNIPETVHQAAEFGILPQNLNNADNFTNAMNTIASQGGGTLLIPPGAYLTGPIHLKSNVHLHFEDGVTLKFLPDPTLYQPVYTWFFSIPCMNYSPMIYAHNETNIKISGRAIVDGQGDTDIWRNMKYNEEIDWDILEELDDERVDPTNRVFGPGHNLRPDLLGIVGCKNVHIEGLTLTGSPLNPIHLILSTDVIIENVTIQSKGFDQIGIVPESSQNILIKDVNIQDVVEGIMIKSGQGKSNDIRAAKNIIIENAKLQNIVYNGIGIGTEIKGGVENVFVSAVSIRNANRAFAIKTDTKKKGPVHHVLVDSMMVHQVIDQAIYCYVFHGNDDGKTADISNLRFSRISADATGNAFLIEGSMKNRIKNVSITESSFQTYKTSYAEDILHFRLSNVVINDSEYNQVFDIGEISDVDFYEEEDEMETLDEDDIELSELPARIRNIIKEEFNMTPVDDIDRMITKTGVFYEIELDTDVNIDTELIISDKGEVVRKEQDIHFGDIPSTVITSLQTALNTDMVPHYFRNIQKVEVKDFSYYKVDGETATKLFMFQMNENGEILEEKTKVIMHAFPTIGEFEK